MQRTIQQRVSGIPTTDGAGVDLVRVIGQPALMDLDPFLLLDVFRSDDPSDYIAGFPPHPHRGFETVTYLLNGKMRHQDNAGHEGVIEAGGIQWMTAGRGIIHSEMPEQENGLLEGFQLWINLPAAHKMGAPAYQEFASAHIPVEERSGSQIRVIAGTTSLGTAGPVSQPLTEPLYFDVSLPASAVFSERIQPGHTAFLYGTDGASHVGGDDGNSLTAVRRDQLVVLGQGDEVLIRAGNTPSRFLLVAGKPLKEPIARGGPFVMNTQEELDQAINDFRSGRF